MQTNPVEPHREQQALAEIERLEERLREAMLAGDVATLDALLSPNVLFTDPGGNVLGKSADLELHRTGRLKLRALEASDRHLRIDGAVAVVSVRMEVAGAFDGQEFAMALRYTRVWQRSASDEWRIVAAHGGPAAIGNGT